MAGAQTEMAVLGGLSVEPQTGYELRNNIRDVLGHFWSESFGQIYPTLARLVDEGLVERTDAGRSGASVYSITPAGTERLRELLRRPIQHRPPRNGLLLRLFFGRQLGVDECIHLLTAAAQEARAELDHLAAVRTEIITEGRPDAPWFLATVDLGERMAAATLEWAEATSRSMAQLTDENHPPSSEMFGTPNIDVQDFLA